MGGGGGRRSPDSLPPLLQDCRMYNDNSKIHDQFCVCKKFNFEHCQNLWIKEHHCLPNLLYIVNQMTMIIQWLKRRWGVSVKCVCMHHEVICLQLSIVQMSFNIFHYFFFYEQLYVALGGKLLITIEIYCKGIANYILLS